MKNFKRIVCKNADRTKSEFIGENLNISGEEKKVEANHKFDWCVKQSFINGSPFLTGHKIEDKNCFGFYLSRYETTYDKYFKKDMKLEEMLSEKIKERYKPNKSNKKTSGNEFSSGKFYAVASSSRFAVASFTKIGTEGKLDYLDSLKINGKTEKVCIEFEHDTPVKGIPAGSRHPQLDVFLKTETQTVFVEVKSHEIVTSHKTVKLSSSYTKTDAFKKLGLDETQLELKQNLLAVKNRQGYLLATDFGCKWSGRHFHFDFKQFLCHLMGVISYAEEHSSEEIYLYYLVYRNKMYENEFDSNSKLYTELEVEIKEIFKIFTEKLQNAGLSRIHFGLCYNDKYDALNELKNEIAE